MKEQLTAIFDIGKTNKKFFLFNRAFKEVYREYTRFEEITDEDGHPSENLEALQQWLKHTLDRILSSEKYRIEAINFSSYGASFVHLDAQGQILTPLYNYTKAYDPELLEDFYTKYGPADTFFRTSGSSNAGMLNSGMQLYWLKYRKPAIFKKIRYSLHLPQYLSFLFTGIPLSEYTSIGCHTAMWDYTRDDYHQWIYNEGLDTILPPIVSTETSTNMAYLGNRQIKIGVGIHDSSAALIPYIRSLKKPFVLLSTGTWSIALNPFTEGSLSEADVQQDCINYMRINGKPVKASRLFLGNEYNFQVAEIAKKFATSPDFHKSIAYEPELHQKIQQNYRPMFTWKSLMDSQAPKESRWDHPDVISTYHQLMHELAGLQAGSILQAIGSSDIKRLYIDGGFTDNQLFLEMLAQRLPSLKIHTTRASLGSALGAAIAISGVQLTPDFLKENYALRKHVPKILK